MEQQLETIPGPTIDLVCVPILESLKTDVVELVLGNRSGPPKGSKWVAFQGSLPLLGAAKFNLADMAKKL